MTKEEKFEKAKEIGTPFYDEDGKLCIKIDSDKITDKVIKERDENMEKTINFWYNRYKSIEKAMKENPDDFKLKFEIESFKQELRPFVMLFHIHNISDYMIYKSSTKEDYMNDKDARDFDYCEKFIYNEAIFILMSLHNLEYGEENNEESLL